MAFSKLPMQTPQHLARPLIRLSAGKPLHPPVFSRAFSNGTSKAKPTVPYENTKVPSPSSMPLFGLTPNFAPSPNVMKQANIKPDSEQYFEFPLGTRFTAPTRELGLSMKDMVSYALESHGLAVLELGFDDPKSHFMLELVEEMGYRPDTHSGVQGALWDITPRPEGIQTTSPGSANGRAHSRSHGVGEFAWHTDGSYEAQPQRFFGLHVVRPDKLGGGVFRVLPAADLVSALSPQAVEALERTELDIRVPDEFHKGVESNRGKLLQRDDSADSAGRARHLLRFRADILFDPPVPGDDAANAAVKELIALLEDPRTKGWRFPDDVFKENVVLLMDNARFLHMRSPIKDERRLLRRVRFHPKV